MAIGNVEHVKECSNKHSLWESGGTARIKWDKETEEEGIMRRVNIWKEIVWRKEIQFEGKTRATYYPKKLHNYLLLL